ncbi:hypothetical protein [Paenibacillus sp. CMAA1364]
MSRLSKRMWTIGIWAGIGILIGMQFATSKPTDVYTTLKQGVIAKTQAPQAITIPLPQIHADQSVERSYTITIKPDVKQPAIYEGPEQEQTIVPNYTDLTPQDIFIPNNTKASVDVLADKTASLLQRASQKGIRLVVSIFNSATQ